MSIQNKLSIMFYSYSNLLYSIVFYSITFLVTCFHIHVIMDPPPPKKNAI